MKKIFASNVFIFLFAILISLPVIFPYFNKGYFPTHDGEWAVVRLGDMYRELRDFQIPPRYSGNLNFGYGYPLFNFAYPFPYYLGFFIHLFHFGFVDSIKILFALSVPLSVYVMFLVSKTLWKNTTAGIVSMLLYAYLPYRFIDLYVRGSLGESVAFVLYPLLFYLIVRIKEKPFSSVLIVCISFTYAFLIMTHNIMALYSVIMVGVVFIGYFFLGLKRTAISLLIGTAGGFLLSAFFWLPALFEKKFILLSKVPIADRNLYFVNLAQLIFPKWGYGTPTDPAGFSYQVGWPHLLLLLLVIGCVLFYFKNKIQSIFLPLLLLSLFFIIGMFQFSAFLWKLPGLSEINYPWTMLLPLGFLVSLLTGYLCTINKWTKYIALTCAFLAVIAFLPYAKPQYSVDRGDSYYLTNDATTTSSDELMPLWVKKKPTMRYAEKVEIVKGKGTITNLLSTSKSTTFIANIDEDAIVRINTIYYPGWQILLDGKPVAVWYANAKGLMDISVGKGTHPVHAKFLETPLRLFGDMLSLGTAVAFAIVGVFMVLKKKSRI